MLLLTFLLTGKQQKQLSKSPLHSTFSTSNCTFYTFSSFLLLFQFTSSHKLHTITFFFDFFDIKTFSNHFFDTKLIKNDISIISNFFDTKTRQKPTSQSSTTHFAHLFLSLKLFFFRQDMRFRHYQGMYSTFLIIQNNF